MTARNFALVIGIVYLAVGVLGFIPALISPPPGDAPGVGITSFHGYLFGLFPINLMHNLVHLAIGAWGVAAARSGTGARAYAQALAIIFAVLAVMGLIPGLNTVFGIVPIHGHDVWLHAGTAIIAAYFGWFAAGRTETTTDKAVVH